MSDHHAVVEFQDEPNLTLSSWVIVLTGVFLIVTLWSGLVYYKSTQSDAMNLRERQGKPTEELKALRHYEATSLQSLRWIDKNKGQIQIPIGLAMDVVRQNYQPK